MEEIYSLCKSAISSMACFGDSTQKTDGGVSGKETDVDKETNTEASKCPQCERWQVELAKARSAEEATVKELKDNLKLWYYRYNNLELRSNELTKQMAGMLEKGGAMENVNDDMSNIKLCDKLGKINNDYWIAVLEWLGDNMKEWKELDSISFLRSLMTKSNEVCEELANKQLRSFLFLGEEEKLPEPDEIPELDNIRRLIGQKESTRQKIKQIVCERVLSSEFAELDILQIEGAREKLSEFLEPFSEFCWLIIFSQPRLRLKFDVVGQPYEGKMRERFSQYSCIDVVKDTTMKKGYIKEVVWPCVELEDGSWFYAKGEIITVEKGINDGTSDDNEHTQL